MVRIYVKTLAPAHDHTHGYGTGICLKTGDTIEFGWWEHHLDLTQGRIFNAYAISDDPDVDWELEVDSQRRFSLITGERAV